jgi:hypothetical protein
MLAEVTSTTRPYPTPMPLGEQVFWLLILAIPIATIARTVVYEEIFREPREWCESQSKTCRNLFVRKFFYLFTCEYCFSHYVTIFFLIITRFKLLIDGWQGYVISFFALVLVANMYLNLYARLRVDITQAKVETKKIEKETETIANGNNAAAGGDGVGAGERDRAKV